MHPAAFAFVSRALIGETVKGAHILEIGAYDVNGTEQGLSVRTLLDAAARYHGIDVRDGPGVDEVIGAAGYDGDNAFDLVISTETLEHMPDPAALFQCAWRGLKPGGRLILTAAGPGRPPHDCDGEPWDGSEPYANIEPEQLKGYLAGWADVRIEENATAHDIYATATKPEASEAKPRPVVVSRSGKQDAEA